MKNKIAVVENEKVVGLFTDKNTVSAMLALIGSISKYDMIKAFNLTDDESDALIKFYFDIDPHMER